MASHHSIPRFIPQGSTPDEAYQRATTIPSNLRRLADTLLGWTLWNIQNDATNATGNLPARFGFDVRAKDLTKIECEIRLTPAASLRAYNDGIVCTHPHGAMLLRTDRFQPLHIDDTPTPGYLPTHGDAPHEPIHWLLCWATVARSFQLLARYERWAMEVLTPRMRIAQGGLRPRKWRVSTVPVLELPTALDSIAEWSGDSERAMLTWIIRDARIRGVEPLIPRI